GAENLQCPPSALRIPAGGAISASFHAAWRLQAVRRSEILDAAPPRPEGDDFVPEILQPELVPDSLLAAEEAQLTALHVELSDRSARAAQHLGDAPEPPVVFVEPAQRAGQCLVAAHLGGERSRLYRAGQPGAGIEGKSLRI